MYSFIFIYKSNMALIVIKINKKIRIKNPIINILLVLLLPKFKIGESIVKINPLTLLTKNRGYRETLSQKPDINLFNYF